MNENILHKSLLAFTLALLVWSGMHPKDRFTWLLEVLPVMIGLVILTVTYTRFKLTSLVYLLLSLHGAILMIGGHYTYAEMPLFNWLRDAFDLGRNYYDRLGHFAQGFVPAITTREILLRRSPLQPGKWLAFLVVCVCLAISAGYELIEFGVALATGEAAEAFLGTQGDVWDTQWDMLLALSGAISALVLLGKYHDLSLRRVAGKPKG
ncbi:MAG: DUF2238 domain-containing protein [Bacillota bacterium]|nr:DUF2238 domain-containing protein [Bacillota bacterium]